MRFPTRRILALTAGALLLTGLAVSQKNNTPEAMLRAGMDKETVDGDLKAAIEQYKRVITQKGVSREVMAKALVRLGQSYEKQGSAEARLSYERVVREFADQVEAMQEARARLDAGPSKAGGKSLREVCDGPDCDGWISPDGRYLSLVINGNLSVRDLSTSQIRQLTHVPDGTVAGFGEWARDSKRLAYFTAERGTTGRLVNRQTVVVNADGSGTRAVYRGGNPYDWSADGKKLLIGAVPGEPQNLVKLMWVDVMDGAVQALPTARLSLDLASVSPDGQYVAFNASKDIDSEENVYVMASDGSRETLISASHFYEEPVGWTPDGKYLLLAEYSGQTSLWAVPITSGKPGVPVLAHRDSGSDVAFRGITRNGAVYYRVSTTRGDLFTSSMDPATGKVTSSPVRVPLVHRGDNVMPRWSPDGKKLLYHYRLSNTDPVENFIYSFDNDKEQRVASSTQGASICWTGDGSAILIVNATGDMALKFGGLTRFNLTTGQATLLSKSGDDLTGQSCGGGLVAANSPSGIRIRNLQNGVDTEIHTATTQPRLSHDGRSVAFVAKADDGSTALQVVGTAAGTAHTVAKAIGQTKMLSFAAWSPDDRFLYFGKRAEGNSPVEMFRVPVSGGAEESTGLRFAGTTPGPGVDVSPDGTRVVLAISESRTEMWAMENFLPAAK